MDKKLSKDQNSVTKVEGSQDMKPPTKVPEKKDTKPPTKVPEKKDPKLPTKVEKTPKVVKVSSEVEKKTPEDEKPMIKPAKKVSFSKDTKPAGDYKPLTKKDKIPKASGKAEKTSKDAKPVEFITVADGGYIPILYKECAKEFRDDCKPDASCLKYFFCCDLCGLPAGYDLVSCKLHYVCYQCIKDMKCARCPFPLKMETGVYTCERIFYRRKSWFKKFLVKYTKITCINQELGCEFVGTCDEVRVHQQTCALDEH